MAHDVRVGAQTVLALASVRQQLYRTVCCKKQYGALDCYVTAASISIGTASKLGPDKCTHGYSVTAYVIISTRGIAQNVAYVAQNSGAVFPLKAFGGKLSTVVTNLFVSCLFLEDTQANSKFGSA